TVAGAALWKRRRYDQLQHFPDSIEARPALCAGGQVLLCRLEVISIVVVIKDQLVICEMSHQNVLSGCNCCRNFCTAWCTLFFAAPSRTFSTRAISSTEWPSKWRRTNAVRSPAVSCFIAERTRTWISELNRLRSGLRSFAGICSTRSES